MAANTLNITPSQNKAKISLHGDMDVAFSAALPRNFTIRFFTSTAEIFTLSSSLYQFCDLAGNLVDTVLFGGRPGVFIELTLDLDSNTFYATANNIITSEVGGGAVSNAITVKKQDITVVDNSSMAAMDGSKFDIFNLLLTNTATATLTPLINPVLGFTYRFFIKQDEVGGRVLNFGPLYKFPDGRNPTLLTLPGNIDIIKITPVVGENGVIYLSESVLGYSTTGLVEVAGVKYDLMSTAITNVQDGGIITLLRNGSMQETLASLTVDKAVCIAGHPTRMPILKVDGTLRLSFGKAIINPEFGEVFFRDIQMTGAAVPLSGNGAAVRMNPGTRYLQFDNVKLFGSENGLLTSASSTETTPPDGKYDIVVQDSIFDNNGHSTTHKGQTHNLYSGSSHRIFALRTKFSNSEFGHDYKSRATKNLLSRCRFEGSKEGRALDIPNGGIVHAEHCYFIKPSYAAQSNLIGIGQEGITPVGRPQQYIFRNCLFENRRATAYQLSFINQDSRSEVMVYYVDCVFLADTEEVYNICPFQLVYTGGKLGPEDYNGPIGFRPRRAELNPQFNLYSPTAQQQPVIEGPDPTLEWFPPTNSPATNPQYPNPAAVIVPTTATKNYPSNGGSTDPNNSDYISPTVSITVSTNTVTSANTNVVFTATATDNIGVTSVELRKGGEVLETLTAEPYSFTRSYARADNGTHAYTVRAYDAAGNNRTSNTINITVDIPEIRIKPTTALDSATQAEYDAAVANATSQKRLAAAGAIANAMNPDHRLYIYKDGVLIIPVEYTGACQVMDDGADVYIQPSATVDSSNALIAGDLSDGVWWFELQGGSNYSRIISGSVGNNQSGADLILDENPEPGQGFAPQLRFILPRSLDGLS